MRMRWKGVSRTWTAAWKEARANRAGFWAQVLAMAVNDVAWVVFWVLFFRRADTLRGWDLDRVLVLFAILTTSAGLVVGLLGNVRNLGSLASSGGLDAALALPTPTLLHLMVRRIETTNVGDFLFGIILFTFAGHPTLQRTAIFIVGTLCSALVCLGFLVMAGSLSFFVGRNEAGELGFHALFLFSSYPTDVFGGFMKVLLYVVVPAGFVSGAPARLVDRFDPIWALALLVAALAFAAAGWATFTLGLRRYTSGAVWTAA